MNRKLYYTVSPQLQDAGDVKETNGWKDITVYEIIDNQPKIFCEIEALTEDNSVEMIQTYLDNNGYEDIEFEFQEL